MPGNSNGPGFVYIIQMLLNHKHAAGKNTVYKIGQTKNIRTRANSIHNSWDCPVKVVAYAFSKNPRQLERAILDYSEKYRCHFPVMLEYFPHTIEYRIFTASQLQDVIQKLFENSYP